MILVVVTRLNYERKILLLSLTVMHLKMGIHIHLCKYETYDLAEGLNEFFNQKVEILRIKHGKGQTLDTLITEEVLLLAKFLRNERKEWKPRITAV
ncbi:MAG: hypothetical protein QCH99_03605 [Candidatus Bathyarchaeota archaeon]|nr:hypothetical protein [Candidatus Bathyarchaeum tardum]WGM88545.1 MAG: hypothetical protein NUK63_06370 [Candidatus Bathyarchaeum tardum]